VNGSLRQLAGGLPGGRNFLVVAAEDPPALPRFEEQLRTIGISSAWQQLPGLYVGLVSLRSDSLDRVVDLLRRNAAGRVGVSPLNDDADRIDLAFRLARTALAASTAADPVTVFDRSPLTMAAIADAEVAHRVVQVVLGGLEDLPPDDRDLLLDTLAAWSTHNGSASETAVHLYCHPNTVRYRLRRLEERTGRSLTDPRAVAELVLALEARLWHGRG
jgi:DNA-binding PucR family transcriptional regulator